MADVLAVLERHGSEVIVSEEGQTLAVINGTQVRFAIEEPVHKVVISKPRVPNPTDRWDYDEVIKREPGGKLVLTIRAYTWGKYEQRTQWSDAKVQRLENVVPEIVAGLMPTAVALRRQDEDRKREEAERERKAREREQLRKEIEEEEKKLEHLNESVRSWDRAERMRRFIAIYAERSSVWPDKKQAESKAWIAWASEQAARMDPSCGREAQVGTGSQAGSSAVMVNRREHLVAANPVRLEMQPPTKCCLTGLGISGRPLMPRK
jgi:predicted RNase H-like nuclease (RuvC/YqgF family)